MKPNRVEKYITIKPSAFSFSKTGKTRVWDVLNTRTNTVVGTISWWGPFRKYCFDPEPDTIFDADCLRLIADATEQYTKEHYAGKKAMLQ